MVIRAHAHDRLIPGLRGERIAQEMTQAELAKRSGITIPTISRLENQRFPAMPNTVRKLADALGIGEERLYGEEVDNGVATEYIPSSVGGRVAHKPDRLLPGLRATRLEVGLSQTDLAEKAGVQRETISNLENLNHPAMRLTIRKLSLALGVEEERLYEAQEDEEVLKEKRIVAKQFNDENFLRVITRQEIDLRKDRPTTLVKIEADASTMEEIGNLMVTTARKSREQGGSKVDYTKMEPLKFRFRAIHG